MCVCILQVSGMHYAFTPNDSIVFNRHMAVVWLQCEHPPHGIYFSPAMWMGDLIMHYGISLKITTFLKHFLQCIHGFKKSKSLSKSNSRHNTSQILHTPHTKRSVNCQKLCVVQSCIAILHHQQVEF